MMLKYFLEKICSFNIIYYNKERLKINDFRFYFKKIKNINIFKLKRRWGIVKIKK